MAEMAMQDTAMDDLEMDEMFDKHLEEHEAPFDDDQATGRSNAVPAHVQHLGQGGQLRLHVPAWPTVQQRRQGL